MRIGEVAALAGVSARAVRHYHQRGLQPEPARLANGYREYTLPVQRDGDELRIVVGNQTDVLLQLSEPVDGIRRVRFRADEPTVLLAAVPGAGAREQSPRG